MAFFKIIICTCCLWVSQSFLFSTEETIANPKKNIAEELQIFQKFQLPFYANQPPLSEEFFEWIDLLEAVDNAKDQFVMVEVGAGYGRWGARGGVAANFREIPYHLVFVEGEPYRADVAIHEEMYRNNIPRSNYEIFNACVGAINKKSYFYIDKDEQTLENWFGQCIILDEDQCSQPLKERYYGCPLILTKYGYRAVEIQQKKLSEILGAIRYPVIDICDFDIQGMEFEVIKESVDVLNKRVKCLHIGTHSHQIERSLKSFLSKNGWCLIRDYPFAQTNQTTYGMISFVDGVQTWHNKRFFD